ncbi:MAG: rod-binding protein [Desulfatiglandales bacterium]
MIGGITSDPVLTETDKDVSQGRLKKTCAEFESIFITYMLKSMRKTVVEAGLLDNTNESKIFKSMFDEKLAIEISKSGGIGLGEILFERLKNENLGASPRNGEPEERGYGLAENKETRPSRHEINISGIQKQHTALEYPIYTM